MVHYLRLLSLVVLLGMLLPESASGQETTISETNSERLRLLAVERVKKYTSYLRLIASSGADDQEEVERYRNSLYELVDNPEMIVFQDLFPVQYRENARTIDLKTYLSDFATYYSGNPELDYEQYQVSPVYQDRNQKQYFLKVSVLRNIRGQFRSQGTVTPHESSEQLDFYLAASVVNQKALLNRIYSIDEHRENDQQFDQVKVVKPLPIQFQGLSTVYQRGRAYPVSWTGGFKGEIVKVGLYQIGRNAGIRALDSSLYNNDNNFGFTMRLQNNVKPGNYLLMIDNSYGLTPSIPSVPFTVRRKIPLAYKILAGAAIGTAGYFAYDKWLRPKPGVTALPPPPALPGDK